MVFSEKVKFPFRGLETDRLVGGRAILESLENAAGSHADSLGDGYSPEGGSGTVWLLLGCREQGTLAGMSVCLLVLLYAVWFRILARKY